MFPVYIGFRTFENTVGFNPEWRQGQVDHYCINCRTLLSLLTVDVGFVKDINWFIAKGDRSVLSAWFFFSKLFESVIMRVSYTIALIYSRNVNITYMQNLHPIVRLHVYLWTRSRVSEIFLTKPCINPFVWEDYWYLSETDVFMLTWQKDCKVILGCICAL